MSVTYTVLAATAVNVALPPFFTIRLKRDRFTCGGRGRVIEEKHEDRVLPSTGPLPL